jgi:hypothetical protein
MPNMQAQAVRLSNPQWPFENLLGQYFAENKIKQTKKKKTVNNPSPFPPLWGQRHATQHVAFGLKLLYKNKF